MKTAEQIAEHMRSWISQAGYVVKSEREAGRIEGAIIVLGAILEDAELKREGARAIEGMRSREALAPWFLVPGQPIPKARARTVVRGGRVMSFTPKTTRDYERQVGVLAQAAGIRPTAAPVAVSIAAFMGDARRRDLDNCCKAITDALNGIAYEDDSQIVDLRLSKRLDRQNPRAVVSVMEVADAE